jgi:hypothetical protein
MWHHLQRTKVVVQMIGVYRWGRERIAALDVLVRLAKIGYIIVIITYNSAARNRMLYTYEYISSRLVTKNKA